jgi:hypothetical protein
MPDNNAAEPITGFADGFNPFSDEIYVPKVEEAPTQNVENTQVQQENVQNVQENVQESVHTEEQQTNTFDPNQFIKERFGFNSVEEAEEEFKKIKEKTSEIDFEFQDNVSKTLFDAIKEGKTDDVYQVLNQQKRLEKLTTAELNTELAVEIVKENLKQKHKELNDEEVDILFYDKFYVPLKPEQGFDETDEDYANKVKNWEAQVNYTEKKLMIEAKTTRSELEKLRSEIKLPDIYNEAGRQAEYQAEFEMMQQARSIYEKTLESDFKSFNGFNISVKDEDVEIPISFNVGDDEKLAIKSQLEDFDSDNYFENRWFDKDGKPNVKQTMQDLYLLENFDKIAKKIANEAAAQVKLSYIKNSGNVTLNKQMPQGRPTQSNSSAFEDLQKAVWS